MIGWFLGKNANKKKYKHQLNVDIPIEYMDHDLSPAVKRGGFVNRTRWKLPCTVNPNDLIDTGIEGVLVTVTMVVWIFLALSKPPTMPFGILKRCMVG